MYELIEDIVARQTELYGSVGRKRTVAALNSFLDAILANHPADDIQKITHDLAAMGVTADERIKLAEFIETLESPDDQDAMRAYIVGFAPARPINT